MSKTERLARLLGGPAMHRVRARLRRRYEWGKDDGDIILGDVTDIERKALEGLLGRRMGGGASMRFDPTLIDAVMRQAGLADSLRHALVLLDGPIVDRRAECAENIRQWDEVRAAACTPQLAALLATPRGMGLLKRLSARDARAAMRLCALAELVLTHLPARAASRSHLAATLLGNAHALDTGRPLATLVLAGLRHGLRANRNMDDDEKVREIWAASGVLVNELARPALYLNLIRADQSGAEMGEPSYLSLRALLRKPNRWEVSNVAVFVCENPNVVAIAADQLGTCCRPIMCTDGMPATAQLTLLTQLQRAGAQLHYHGDFDWPGILIANTVIGVFGALPWQMGAVDYCAALRVKAPDRRALAGGEVEPLWDANLFSAMRAHGWAVDEEAVIDQLLWDLDLSNSPLARPVQPLL